ncbi:nucleoside triphosphate pyrophosphohydrolase [uncultured Kriegella sp.]|uniref:nucleoside triphosphate pyrophosphohydrolase n=1 Tax=uncultured Kriegella sp. TaxID=1798910 RepID=UPI0030DDD769|tara:strand:+ start:161156 stop:163654 length:2499 start_codon:yes stop_codon:yes gene_type:complete
MNIKNRHVLGSWETLDIKKLNVNFIGGKAMGLFSIPKKWTLPFLVFTKNFYKSWTKNPDVENIINDFSNIDKEILIYFLRNIISNNSRIFIRSNSPFEDISLRGKYQSIIVSNSIENISEKISELLNSTNSDPMFLILQECISPGLPGHMSNERRISEKANRWMVEISDQNQEFIVSKPLFFDGNLTAKKEKDIFSALRKVGGSLNSISKNGDRFHCEWVWDSKMVWVVQVDKSIKKEIKNSATSKIERKEKPVPRKKKFKVLTHFTDTNAENWKKLRSPINFVRANLPVSDVYLLKGEDLNNQNQKIQKNIKEDLEKMCDNHPIVIRCDIAKTLERDDLLLPTSGSLINIDDILLFLNKVNRKFSEDGLKSSQWTFLISYLFSTKASALIHAFPNAQRIQIDALWGYPDGLLYYPHDTWYYYTESDKTKQKKDYKSVCLFPDDEGWKPYKIVEPYDWNSVLNKKEAVTLGRWAINLANLIGHEIQLMAFVKLEDSNAVNGCLPWHYTNLPVKQYSNSLRVLPDSNTIRTIDSWSNLMSLKNISSDRIKGLLIMPSHDLLRADDFLTECSQYAFENSIPLYFQGSLLGHAYYIMTKTGANVIPIAKSEPKENKITYNKLVRDKIPIIIKEAGGLARVRRLSKEEAIKLLSQKLIEEALEVWNAKNEQERLNEIADISEVMDSLIKFSKFNNEDVEKIKNKKIKKRGGFEDLIFLEETAIRPLKNIDNLEGRLPLFNEESTSVKSTSKKKNKSIKFITDNVNKNIIHFEVPLIPQIDKLLKPKIIEEVNSDLRVIIQYHGSNLKVEISRSASFDTRKKPEINEEGYQFSLLLK